MPKPKLERCPNSGQRQVLSWLPDDDTVPSYPGAVVCVECCAGVQVVRGSVRKAPLGYLSGQVRVHRLNPDNYAQAKR